MDVNVTPDTAELSIASDGPDVQLHIDAQPESATISIWVFEPETEPSFFSAQPPTGELIVEGYPLAPLPLEWTFLSEWLYNRAVVVVYDRKYDVVDTLLEDGTRAFVALQDGVEVANDPMFDGLMAKLHPVSVGQFAW